MKEIKEILEITKSLREQYKKDFTLDGKLVGDIGEVLVSEKYGIELYSNNTQKYDGYEKNTNKQVQIKSSFKSYCYFPYGHIPDYFLAVNILENGDLEEMYNGTGQFLFDNYIEARKLTPYKNTFYTLSRGVLEKLNNDPMNTDKIQKVL